MRKHLLTVLFVVASLFTGASADTVRLPQDGTPAFVLTLPDGWTAETTSRGNIAVRSADHNANFLLKILSWSGTLDEVGRLALNGKDGAQPDNMGPVEISGYRGNIYEAHPVNDSGVHIVSRLTVLRIDDSRVALIDLSMPEGLGGKTPDEAQAILASLKIE